MCMQYSFLRPSGSKRRKASSTEGERGGGYFDVWWLMDDGADWGFVVRYKRAEGSRNMITRALSSFMPILSKTVANDAN